MIEIEKNVPIPKTRARGHRKYPWNDMQPGDSFFVACSMEDREEVQRNLLSACNQYRSRNKNGWRFRTAQADGGVRIWRVS